MFSDLEELKIRHHNNLDDYYKKRAESLKYRDKFVDYFNLDKIRHMPINEYALGYEKSNQKMNFCYGLERKLDGLGRITGSTSSKFGVYNGKRKGDDEVKLRSTQVWGKDDPNKAYLKIRDAIVELIVAGEREDIDTIVKSKLSNMFKAKILSTYYPENYLSVFSEDHLDHFITMLHIDFDTRKRNNTVRKRIALMEYIKADKWMSQWPLLYAAEFFYSEYPKAPLPYDDEVRATLRKKPEIIDLEILNNPISKRKSNTKKSSQNPDYLELQRHNKKLGNLGEQIVLKYEKDSLKKYPELRKKVKRADLDSDGYDILSFSVDGKEKYIEVKTTSSSMKDINFFLSKNELEKSKKLDNYFVYIVFRAKDEKTAPRIWPIKNPFNPENKDVNLEPINYKVNIKTGGLNG